MMLQLFTIAVVLVVSVVLWDLYRPAHRDLPLRQFHWAAPLVGRISRTSGRRRA